MEQITLYYRQGSSDKIYQAAIEPKDGGFVVNFAYGRRGTTLQTGTKTNSLVSYDAAKLIYDKLVREKTAKGYTPGEDGTPYQHSDKQATGILPQLLNTVDEAQLAVLLSDSNHVMQEKFDGRRLLIQKQGPSSPALISWAWCRAPLNHRGGNAGIRAGLPDRRRNRRGAVPCL